MKTDYVVGIGELLWDCFPTYRRMGGAPANFAYHAAQFGYHTMVVSAVGEDSDGDELINLLEAHKQDSCIQRVGLPTGTVTIDTSVPDDPKYTINTDVAWSDISYTNKLAIIAKNCTAVCFGTLAQYGSQTHNTIVRFLDAVPKDCYKIYDVNLRRNPDKALYSDDIIIASIALCNVLKTNADELDYLTTLFSFDRNESVELRSRRLLAKCPNIKILIVTMGTKGSLVFSGTETSFLETPKVEVVDAVGAGDSFTGAFIGSILDGKTFKEAHQIAVNVSAYVCTQSGATPVVPEFVRE
ncbi:MAG: carbohydrate kinase [Bacteroidales bacterium]|jgi:fructokinase|nr:carbohydrate kinase [Bacteroidales bacterium]